MRPAAELVASPMQQIGRHGEHQRRHSQSYGGPLVVAAVPAVDGQPAHQRIQGPHHDLRPAPDSIVCSKGLNWLAEWIADASAMSSTTGGAAGPGGSLHKMSCFAVVDRQGFQRGVEAKRRTTKGGKRIRAQPVAV